MIKSAVLVAYNEIALKSKPVRRNMEIQLTDHIKNMLARQDMNEAQFDRTQGRIIVRNVDPDKAADIISRVFGVASVMPSTETSSQLDNVIETAADLASKVVGQGQSFAVNARRVGKHPYTSKDIENKLGEEILRRLSDKGVRVNLGRPEKTIHVEVRSEAAYIYTQVLNGPGGLPYGSQGKLISLFSGGIDSPVATWLMMKRGAYVMPLFLDQKPYVGNDYLGRALEVARKIREYVPLSDYPMYVASVGDLMKRIVEGAPSKLTCVLCKRMMYRAACHLAQSEGAYGIATGESLGQVASQTLANLMVLDEASTLPIYRPLVGFEKQEIVDIAKKIGTYELSIKPVHGCSSVPQKPTTMAKLEEARRYEKKLHIEEALSDILNSMAKLSL